MAAIRASADDPASTLFVRLTPARIQRWGHRQGLLTDRNPSDDYGTDTVQGVARRLLRPLRRCEAAQ